MTARTSACRSLPASARADPGLRVELQRRQPAGTANPIIRSMAHTYRRIAELTRKTAGSVMSASAPWARRSTASLSSYAAQAVRRFYREKVTGTHNDRRQLFNGNAPTQETLVVTDVPARFPAEHPVRPARIHQNDREQE